jgi:hypothetical protein
LAHVDDDNDGNHPKSQGASEQGRRGGHGARAATALPLLFVRFAAVATYLLLLPVPAEHEQANVYFSIRSVNQGEKRLRAGVLIRIS